MAGYTGFDALASKLATRGDVKNPAALAASIGRKKYGAGRFNKAAATGRKLGPAPAKSERFGGR